MQMILNIPFLFIPQCAMAVGIAYLPVIAYLWAQRRWPQRRIMLQMISLSALAMMSLPLLAMVLGAGQLVLECNDPLAGWSCYFSGLLNTAETVRMYGSLSWLVRSLIRDVLPAAMCMLILFGVPSIRRQPYHCKGLLLVALLPVAWIIRWVVLFLMILVGTFLGDVFSYWNSLYTEYVYRLY